MTLLRSVLSRLALLSLLIPGLALAQGAVVTTEQVRAELVAHAPEGVEAGKPLALGLLIRHQPHWHTYWKNPGDSGLPTTLAWELPAGVTAGEIQWPAPQRLPVGPLVNYGYENDLLLAVPVTVGPEFKGDTLNIKLRADWLVCKEVCIPESGEFTLKLPAAAATAGQAAAFERARAALPRALDGAPVEAKLQGEALALTVAGLPAAWQGKTLLAFPEEAGVFDHAAKPVQQWSGASLQLSLPVSAQRSESPTQLAVVLRPAEGAGEALRVAYRLAAWPALPGAAPAPALQPAEAAAPAAPNTTSILAALALAFAGGLLLNLMPCVFPVLSLKVLGFTAHATDRRLLAAGGLAYTAGVVLSFLALAGLLLALRSGGAQLGWGFQLQSPGFVAGLALLFGLIGLNLLGVFEVRAVLPGNLAGMRIAHPLLDHGLTGVLAVVVASPCTAPFMGVALGAALTQPAPQALAIFAALGLGMAAPYLAASLWPGLARALPRPGAWMSHFKILMAFPMFATVLWLLWVLGQQVGIDGAIALLGLLLALALAAWVFGAPDLKPRGRAVLGTLALAILAATALWAWPALREQPGATAQAETSATWQSWSAERVAAAQAEGRPVLVDFTAAWCVTCQFNKRGTLADAQLVADLQAKNVLLLRADWTRRDAAISQELNRLGRSGVPVYAVYKPGAAAPQLLPEILSVALVREALSL